MTTDRAPLRTLFTLVSCCLLTEPAFAQALPRARPEDVGLSTAALDLGPAIGQSGAPSAGILARVTVELRLFHRCPRPRRRSRVRHDVRSLPRQCPVPPARYVDDRVPRHARYGGPPDDAVHLRHRWKTPGERAVDRNGVYAGR